MRPIKGVVQCDLRRGDLGIALRVTLVQQADNTIGNSRRQEGENAQQRGARNDASHVQSNIDKANDRRCNRALGCALLPEQAADKRCKAASCAEIIHRPQ